MSGNLTKVGVLSVIAAVMTVASTNANGNAKTFIDVTTSWVLVAAAIVMVQIAASDY